MGKYPQSAFLKWECGPTENTSYLSIDYEDQLVIVKP